MQGLITFDRFAFHMYFYCISVLSLNEDSPPPETFLHVKQGYLITNPKGQTLAHVNTLECL